MALRHEAVNATNTDVLEYALGTGLMVSTPRLVLPQEDQPGKTPHYVKRFDADSGLTTRLFSPSKRYLEAEFYPYDVRGGKQWHNRIFAFAWQPHAQEASEQAQPELYFSISRRDEAMAGLYGVQIYLVDGNPLPRSADFYIPVEAWPLAKLRGKRIVDALYNSVVKESRPHSNFEYNMWAAFFEEKANKLPDEAALAIQSGLSDAEKAETPKTAKIVTPPSRVRLSDETIDHRWQSASNA